MFSRILQDKSNQQHFDRRTHSNSTILTSQIISDENYNPTSVDVFGKDQIATKSNTESNLNKQKQTNDYSSQSNSLTEKNSSLGQVVESTPSNSSNIWQYATRVPKANYAICNLCPDKQHVSANNGSTSTIRKHLINKHGKIELKLPIRKKIQTNSCSIDNKRKKHLHELIIRCIIKDGRNFNDMQKPGMKHILQELVPGMFFLRINYIFYRLIYTSFTVTF